MEQATDYPESEALAGAMLVPVKACPNCGYSIRGLPSNRCPECGQQFPDFVARAGPTFRVRLAWALLIPATAVGIGAFTALIPEGPHLLAPFPITVLYPRLLCGSAVLATVPVIVMAAFLSLPVVLGRTRVPRWTSAPVAVLVVLAWIWAGLGFGPGLERYGVEYVEVCAFMQLLFTICLVSLWLIARAGGFTVVYSWHLTAAVWLASYAFPLYGMLP